MTVQVGLTAAVTRQSWYQIGQEPLTGGALVAKLMTKHYDSTIPTENQGTNIWNSIPMEIINLKL